MYHRTLSFSEPVPVLFNFKVHFSDLSPISKLPHFYTTISTLFTFSPEPVPVLFKARFSPAIGRKIGNPIKSLEFPLAIRVADLLSTLKSATLLSSIPLSNVAALLSIFLLSRIANVLPFSW